MVVPIQNFSDPQNQIGLCGVYCPGCPAYMVRCYGCRSMKQGLLQKRVSKWNCKKRGCVLEKNLNHCGECSQISCSLRRLLEKSYLQKYSIDLAENCHQIKILGAQKWLDSQKKKYTCSSCGQRFSPYDLSCKKCVNHGN